jgi:L-ribulokinase
VALGLETGAILGTGVARYAHGVADRANPLPSLPPLRPGWVLQHPADYLPALEMALAASLRTVNASSVRSLGIDFTSSSVLPVSADLVPLALVDQFAHEPHAFVKLWKHHASDPHAKRFEAAAPSAALDAYGGHSSAEWLFAKGLETFAGAPEVFRAAVRFLEAGDWVVSQLVGEEVRGFPAAAFKAHWQPGSGYPDPAWLERCAAGFSAMRERLTPPREPWRPAGTLSPAWAERWHLPRAVPVSTMLVDAYAGLLSLGIQTPGIIGAILGTSGCLLSLTDRFQPIAGMAGMIRDGILPGLWAVECGHGSLGDSLDWCCALVGQDPVHLEQQAREVRPDAVPVVVDWWNGSRSPLMDNDLSGVMLRLRLDTRPQEIYKGFVEALAFGAAMVVEAHRDAGLFIGAIRACGGVAETSSLLLETIASMTGLPVFVSERPHLCAVGAAIWSTVAAGLFVSPFEAIEALARQPFRLIEPAPVPTEVAARYALYRRLYSVPQLRDWVRWLGAS